MHQINRSLAGGEGSGVRGRTAVGDCRPHCRSDAAHQVDPARLGILGSAAGRILFGPDTGRDGHHARDLLRFDGVPRQPRRSASTQHSRSRPCRAESDALDGTSAFGTVDYGPFATRRPQARSFGCAGLAQTRLSPGLGEIVVVGGGLVHDPPEFDSQLPAPSPPAPLPQTSLGERGARAKGLVSKWCSGLWSGGTPRASAMGVGRIEWLGSLAPFAMSLARPATHQYRHSQCCPRRAASSPEQRTSGSVGTRHEARGMRHEASTCRGCDRLSGRNPR